jgi:nicotinate-nucleotide adenylyltransferase
LWTPSPDHGRLGLLGGTFDPPHYGHLVAAQEAAWQLRLDRVLFIPARQNPLKLGDAASSIDDRCRMVELAIADDARFALSLADLDRPGPSYTVDLLRQLRATLDPSVELYFLAGADVLQELPDWHQPRQVVELATAVVVLGRPGWAPPDGTILERQLDARPGCIRGLSMPGVDISSRALRERVRTGQPISYLTPPAVEAYIVGHELYHGRDDT